MSAECGCPEQCGRPATTKGYSRTCYKRWTRHGSPAGGPPPLQPVGRQAEADLYDITWAAGEPERRATRARRWAGALVQCVAADDAKGIAIVLGRVSDWQALAVVLAECADPARTAIVTGQPARATGNAERLSAPGAGERTPGNGSVALRAAQEDSDAA